MIEVSNVALVTGPLQEVARFVRLAAEDVAWGFATDWDKPSPPTTGYYGNELEPGETQMTISIATDWYPATHSLIAASRECPAVSILTDFTVENGPVSIYGSADVRDGQVGYWDYHREGQDRAGFHGDSCPVRWWEQSAEAMDAWSEDMDASSDDDDEPSDD